jgi:hypothetical protein
VSRNNPIQRHCGVARQQLENSLESNLLERGVASLVFSNTDTSISLPRKPPCKLINLAQIWFVMLHFITRTFKRLARDFGISNRTIYYLWGGLITITAVYYILHWLSPYILYIFLRACWWVHVIYTYTVPFGLIKPMQYYYTEAQPLLGLPRIWWVQYQGREELETRFFTEYIYAWLYILAYPALFLAAYIAMRGWW